MKSAITVCLVPEARSGPFVFHDGLRDGCRIAAELGFEAVEVFPPSGDSALLAPLAELLSEFDLQLAAMGTGAGWIQHQLTLSSTSGTVRSDAREFIRAIIDAAGPLGAPAIIGSMQGRVANDVNRLQVLEWFADAILDLSKYAFERYRCPLLIEPLNRYETNLFNRVAETAQWLESIEAFHCRVLADLFHMNIEETNVAQAIRDANHWIGHVHFADSNRWAIGFGHTPTPDVIDALHDVGYTGYLSAEIFPQPNPDAAARMTAESFRRFAPVR